MKTLKLSLLSMAIGSLLIAGACQKEIATIGSPTKGDFDVIQRDDNHFVLINKTKGSNISTWNIPNLGKSFQGDSVSLYIGGSGTYDVLLYPATKGGIDSVVKQIKVAKNDPVLFKKQSDIVVSGWYNDGWNAESHQIYMNNNTLFSEVNPYWYNLGTGTDAIGKTVADGSIYERSYAFNASMITQVRNKGDLFIPTVGDMSTGQLNTILSNTTARQNLINNLVNKAIQRNYDGWDLNFEHANESGKQAFSLFVHDLGAALQAQGKVLDVTIGGFENATKESYWIFDYDGLNIPQVRYIKIMAYDQFLGPNPSLNPVGDINWVEDILNYAITTRGVPAKKIILGIANYGWSFKQNPTTQNMEIIYPFTTYSQYMAKAGFASWYQPWCEELYGEWTENGIYHAAFFNNAESVGKRLALVNTYGIAGVCFWVLGREDAAIYSNKIPTILGAGR
ncbi:glycosyl hydrolase family 18 protein [Sphingobacterium thalpophilum]|uniref:Glycosyl hydrolase family 18 protein n=1 Tax=Sphingobacterium thalpophilum TaxID=259 RepID=A0ACD5C9C0_9SPHI